MEASGATTLTAAAGLANFESTLDSDTAPVRQPIRVNTNTTAIKIFMRRIVSEVQIHCKLKSLEILQLGLKNYINSLSVKFTARRSQFLKVSTGFKPASINFFLKAFEIFQDVSGANRIGIM